MHEKRQKPEEVAKRRGSRTMTAWDFRDRLGPITGWSQDDLRQLPIFQGEAFEAGEVYFNLNLPDAGPFRANGSETVDPGYLFVAKGSVPDEVWLRLIDSWGSDLPMGNYAPSPGAFDGRAHHVKTGYGSAGQEGAGEGVGEGGEKAA